MKNNLTNKFSNMIAPAEAYRVFGGPGVLRSGRYYVVGVCNCRANTFQGQPQKAIFLAINEFSNYSGVFVNNIQVSSRFNPSNGGVIICTQDLGIYNLYYCVNPLDTSSPNDFTHEGWHIQLKDYQNSYDGIRDLDLYNQHVVPKILIRRNLVKFLCLNDKNALSNALSRILTLKRYNLYILNDGVREMISADLLDMAVMK
jgi:hypothetical protein